MPLVKTPRAIREIFGAPDAEGHYPVTGYEIEQALTWEGEGAEHFSPRVVLEEATAQQVADLKGESELSLTGSLQTLNAQNAALQTRLEAVRAQRDRAIEALNAVAQADTQWDSSPRTQVTNVLNESPA